MKLEIVRLAGDGSNWVSYRDRMGVILRMRRWQDHLTSARVTQAYRDRGDVNGIAPNMRWEDDDEAVKALVMSSIPDELFNRIKSGATAQAWWDSLKDICEDRSRSLSIDLRQKLQNTRCGDDDDVRAHFAKLANFREQLAAMGQSVPDQQYADILIASLPPFYDMRICAITTNADETGRPINPARIVKFICDDYDKRIIGKEADKKSEDQAFAAQVRKRKNKSDIECFNCKKKGHIKAECWAKGGGKEGQGPRRNKRGQDKASESAASAADKTEDIESWAIQVDEDWSFESLICSSNSADSEASEDLSDTDVESWASIGEADFADGESDVESDDAEAYDACTQEAASVSEGNAEAELYDSGASRHISPFRHRFVTYQPITPRPISAADKRVFYAIGTGTLQIEVPNGPSAATPILLREALHAPDIGATVVSIGRIAKAGYTVLFDGGTCKIQNKNAKIVGQIPVSQNGLYKVEREHAGLVIPEDNGILALHRRLGHIPADAIRALLRHNVVTGLQLLDDKRPIFCESCEYAKATRKRINKERTTPPATSFGEEIHSDLWGPSPTSTIGGRKYYVTFTDDFSRFTVLELLKTKDQTLQAYKAFSAWAETQHGSHIKRLRSDRGGEYTSNAFTQFLQEQGTERRLTTHDTPEHNGVAESLNRRLLERVRAILHHSDLPKNLWGEAIMFAVWLKNRTSTRALGHVTPFEKLYGIKPDLGGLPEWGQRVWVHTDKGSKLDARAVEGRWVGYDRNSTHAHRVYWPEKHSVSVERNIKFVPITYTLYSPAVSIPATHPLPAIAQAPQAPPLPSLPSGQQPAIIQPTSIALPPSRASTPEAPSEVVPLRAELYPYATESGEEEMPEEEDTVPATPASSPIHQPTLLRTPTAPGKGKSPAQPPGAPRKAKDSPAYQQPVRRSVRIAEQSRRAPSRSESSSSAPIRKRRMPGGLGTPPTGADEDIADVALSAEEHLSSLSDTEDFPELSNHQSLCYMVAVAIQEVQGDPKTLQQARSRTDWPQWQEAMDREISTLEGAHTWESVPRPPGKNIVGSKWVFRIKRNAEGKVQKYKARLVARGFTQVFGQDYYDTFSPVARLASFRAVLALAARHDWEIDVFDFIGAYLNGELDEDEEIYMQPPPGYEGQGENVMRLRKSLYGLKQAGRKWYEALARALVDLGFRITQADPGVFYLRMEIHIIILVIHVDDCVITGSCARLIATYKAKFNSRYALTDLGPVSWLLGIKVTRNREDRTISLSQTTYINTMLERFALTDAKPYRSPMVPGIVYSKDDSPSSPQEAARMEKVPYREAIGSLMYASVATRPDISFAVAALSQFLDNPGEVHWEAVKRILRYLSGTKDFVLTYGDERHDLIGYTDADGATQEHRRAISGHAFLIDGGAVSWSSKKQELVTLSTAEAEYVAATHAAKEALWLRRLVFELFPSLEAPTVLYCDNQAALRLIEDDNYRARTKHIDKRYHFVREAAQTGALQLTYCPTDDMTADILTKALPKWKATIHTSTLGLHTRA